MLRYKCLNVRVSSSVFILRGDLQGKGCRRGTDIVVVMFSEGAPRESRPFRQEFRALRVLLYWLLQ